MRIRSGFFQWTVLAALTLAFCGTAGAGENVRRIQAWKTDGFAAGAPVLPLDLRPSLQAPALFREPEYTWGLSNTLYWSSDSVNTQLAPLGITLLFFEIQASYSGYELWGMVNAGVDSARFLNLPEGIPIEYTLRYYARNASGTYRLSDWSLPTTSVQDNHRPVLVQWDIVGLQKTLSGNWVVSKAISIHVNASDTSGGKIMGVDLREISPSGDSTAHYIFQQPQADIDTTLPYIIRESEKKVTELRIWVKDVSGKDSEIGSVSFFWWSSEDRESKMVCFPNPFNPDKGQLSTIKLDVPGYNEAGVFDPFGNLVRVLRKPVESLFFEWDGKNNRGETVSNGAYLCVLKENQRMYCKIVVLK